MGRRNKEYQDILDADAKVYDEPRMKYEKFDSFMSGMIAGFPVGALVVGVTAIVLSTGNQSTSERVSIVPKCEEVANAASVGPNPIELDVLPEAIARGGVCKMGELVVPIVARAK